LVLSREKIRYVLKKCANIMSVLQSKKKGEREKERKREREKERKREREKERKREREKEKKGN
jgi:hypothetical protein